MTHKVVSAVVALILAVFIGAAFLFALSVQSRVPAVAGGPRAPHIPHGVTGDKARCVTCHTVARLPASHERYAVTACRSCHAQRGAPFGLPHPLDAQTATCDQCHRVQGGTLPVTHRDFPTGSCTSCHPQQPAMAVPHTVAMGDDKCVLCHGDPTQALGMPEDHLRLKDVACGFCHQEEANRARVQPREAGVSALPAPTVQHPVTGPFKNCLWCHREGGHPSLPPSHEAFGQDTCRYLCHLSAGSGTTGN